MSAASVFHRVVYSFAGNVLRAGLSFVTGLLLARGLGPEEYGVFGFLLASFTASTQLLDMGSSNAFFSFISKRQRSRVYILYYVLWQLLQFLLLLSFIAVLAPEWLVDQLWQGTDKNRVMVALLAVFLQQKAWTTVSQIGESQRFTAQVQMVSVLIAVVHLVIVVLLLLQDMLSVEVVYWVIAAEFAVGIALAYWSFPLQFERQQQDIKEIFQDYKRYCLPLVPNAWILVLTAFADTWLLQKYGGAVEQAYFAVAMQFSVISLIATRSVLNILWKEVAEAYAQRDLARVRVLFERAARLLYYLAALISGFLIPWAGQIIGLVLGTEYLAGTLAMMIMFLYPVDQARGQVVGTMLLAMEDTRATLFFGVSSNLLGLVLAWFLLADSGASVAGLGLGAVGLAVKMVLIQFITVNASLWWISHKLQMAFAWLYQFVALGGCLLLGYASYLMVNAAFAADSLLLMRGFVGGVCYLAMVALFIVLFASQLGICISTIKVRFSGLVAALINVK